jgi:hypothetical protein
LNEAFELQIEKVIDWKVNYRTETVENLKNEILDDTLTNPLEKLEKFKKLKEEVNLSVWSIAKKREKSTNWVEKNKLKEQLENLKAEYKHKKENNTLTENRKKEIIEEWNKIRELLNIEKPKWDIDMWWDIKIEKISSEKE